MKTRKEIFNELAQFHGTENYYKHQMGFIYTDGIKFLAEATESYWFLDIVGSYQFEKKIKQEEFQVYHLKVNEDHTAEVIISDGNDNILGTQSIPYTDFPLDEIKIWLVSGTLMLPSEY